MHPTIAKYAAITSINLQNQLAYVWDTVGRAVSIILFMFVLVQLWTAVYAGEGGAAIAGLTLTQTVWYLLMAETVELGKVRHDANISAEVLDGTIAYTLVRPYHYLAYHFWHGLAEQVVKLALTFLLGLPIVLWSVGRLPYDWRHLLPLLLVIVLATLIDFTVHAMIGLLAFITEDVQSFRLIYQKLVFVLGGLLLPLDFMPAWLRQIALVLPFQLTTYAPAKLLVAFSWGEWRVTLLRQALWLLLLGGLLLLQFRAAARRLAVNGG